MSFSFDVKEELEKVIPNARHCRLAALAAILLWTGEIAEYEQEDETAVLTILTERPAEMRKCFTLLRKGFNIEAVLQQNRPGGSVNTKNFAEVVLPRSELRNVLDQLHIDINMKAGRIRDHQDIVSALLLEKECCRRAYLREMFIACGSITDPSKDYHLEFDCISRQQAQQVQDVLRGWGNSAGIVLRGKMHIVYLKDSTDIVDTLNLMGAPVSMMAMENQRILKDLRNTVNRRVNCETANIGKTVNASRKQIEEIQFLEKKGILRTLPKNLQQIAALRCEYPDTPLRELGEMADPPIGKSGVNHRLRRLMEIAEKHRVVQGD